MQVETEPLLTCPSCNVIIELTREEAVLTSGKYYLQKNNEGLMTLLGLDDERKTLLVVNEHGILFDIDPLAFNRLSNLVLLKLLTFWKGEKTGACVILTDTAYAKFERNYLKNSM
ncbi:hypothetical protein RhiirA4_481950 [Rhizophagus irregularis]|uniref:Uncharacterized protein n=1 Tax=Rhizophagus irregularis TaxID=588596 RepID=A0A2I1HKB6_9GLOM|nr:hypothetical protein RhiirA4_481950 [Rhizophagus irregularis]